MRFSQCQHSKRELCRVVPGDEIVGRLTESGAGKKTLIVFKSKCPTAKELASRLTLVPLTWIGSTRPGEAIKLRIQAVDRPRLLEQVLDPIYRMYDEHLNVMSVQASVGKDRVARIEVTVEAQDTRPAAILKQALSDLLVEGVLHDVQVEILSPIDKLLLAEHASMPNPYVAGPPLRDARIFKGRDFEIQRILTSLKGQQNLVVLVGYNRIGKSSVIYHIHDYRASEHNFVPVVMSCLNLDERSERAFWRRLAANIELALPVSNRSAGKRYRHARNAAKTGAFEDFNDWLKEAKELVGGRKLLIMIDELSVIDERWAEYDGIDLGNHLKALVEEHREVAFVLCVQEALYETDSYKKKALTWPVVRSGLPIKLGHLDKIAAERLVTEPLGQMLTYRAEVIDEIVKLTAGHPFYLQLVLTNLVQKLGTFKTSSLAIEATSQDLAEAVDKALAVGEQIFGNYLRDCPQFELTILSALASKSAAGDTWDERGVTIEEVSGELDTAGLYYSRFGSVTAAMSRLCALGILHRSQSEHLDRYYLNVPMFGRWLRASRPLKEMVAQLKGK